MCPELTLISLDTASEKKANKLTIATVMSLILLFNFYHNNRKIFIATGKFIIDMLEKFNQIKLKIWNFLRNFSSSFDWDKLFHDKIFLSMLVVELVLISYLLLYFLGFVPIF